MCFLGSGNQAHPDWKAHSLRELLSPETCTHCCQGLHHKEFMSAPRRAT